MKIKKSDKSNEGKSQKQTISSKDVHYGYFSSIRTSAYRKGWDNIFGKRNFLNSKDDNSWEDFRKVEYNVNNIYKTLV